MAPPTCWTSLRCWGYSNPWGDLGGNNKMVSCTWDRNWQRGVLWQQPSTDDHEAQVQSRVALATSASQKLQSWSATQSHLHRSIGCRQKRQRFWGLPWPFCLTVLSIYSQAQVVDYKMVHILRQKSSFAHSGWRSDGKTIWNTMDEKDVHKLAQLKGVYPV